MFQFSSVTQSCPTLCDPMNHNTPGLPVYHQCPEFTQAHVHLVGDAIQPSHPLSSPSPPAPNSSQHQGFFHWVKSLHEVAKVVEFQLQHHSFQRTPRGRQYLENQGNIKKTNHRITNHRKCNQVVYTVFFSTFEKGSWVSVQSAGCRDQPCS